MTNLKSIAGTAPARLLLATLALSVLAIAIAGALSGSAKASHFAAGKLSLKRLCERYDADFWSQGRRYGCGEQVLCTDGQCRTRRIVILHREPEGHGEHGGIAGSDGVRGRGGE